MRTRIVLVILLLGIIFPIHWISHLSSTSHMVLDTFSDPEWMKIIIHFVTYAGLGILLVIIARLPPRLSSVLIIFGSILVVGILQEIFQWLTRDVEGSAITALQRSAFDLGIDFLGGLLGVAVIFWAYWKSGRWQYSSKHK